MNEGDIVMPSMYHFRFYYQEEVDAKTEEIERLKAQHEEMLLKHAKEQGAALESLEESLKEIERMTQQAIHFRDMAEKQGLLLIRAADALEKYTAYPIGMVMSVTLRETARDIIADLRKAAE